MILYRVIVCLETVVQGVWVLVECYTSYLVWKPEGKVPLGKHKRRFENIIKMDFQKVRCSTMS